jgi:hypothetical protein
VTGLGVVTDHRRLHAVVEDLLWHATECFEGGDMAAQDRRSSGCQRDADLPDATSSRPPSYAGGRLRQNGGRLQIGMLDGIRSEWWAPSDQNAWTASLGIRTFRIVAWAGYTTHTSPVHFDPLHRVPHSAARPRMGDEDMASACVAGTLE